MKYFKFIILFIVTLFISSNLYAIGKVHFPKPKEVAPLKITGTPGLWRVYSSANTNGFGVLGPDTATTNVYLKPTEEAPDTGDNYIRLGAAETQTVDGVSSTVIPFTYEVLPTGGSGSISVNSSVVNDPNLISTADITISNNAGSVSCLVNSLALSKIAASSITTSTEMDAEGDTVLDDTTVLTAGATYALIAQILGLPNLVITSPINNAWVNSSTTSFAGTASDNGSISLIEWKLETGGTYANATGTTSWSQAGPWGSDGTNKTAYFRATDNEGNQIVKSVRFNLDTINPVVGTVTPSITTHDGTGATVNVTIANITEINESYRQWSLYDVTDSAIQINWTTFTGLSISGIVLPADQHIYRLDVRCTDLAGNVGTASSANIVYEAPGSGLEDTFTDTDSTALASHTSDSSHTWTQNGGGAVRIHTNRAESAESTNVGFYYSSFTPTDADYSVSVDTMNDSASGAPVFPAIRCSTSAATMYAVRWDGTTTWELTKWVSGTRTVIGTYAGDAPTTQRTLVLSASGSTIAVSIGGVSRISVTDTDITTAGRPGIGTWYNDASDYHIRWIDNYEVTD